MSAWPIIKHKFRTLPFSVFLRKVRDGLKKILLDFFLPWIRSPKSSGLSFREFSSIIGALGPDRSISLLDHPLAVFPGRNWEEADGFSVSTECTRIAEDSLDHIFDLLGSGRTRVDYSLTAAGFGGHVYKMAPGKVEVEKQQKKMTALIRRCIDFVGEEQATPGIENHQPIDWHVDFRSGYRFAPHTWYRKIPRVSNEGVDIKVPWSLSRFQHMVPLAYYGRGSHRCRDEFMMQVIDWVCANPVGWGVNWSCTMEAAIRSVNWLWAAGVFELSAPFPGWFKWLLSKSLYEHGNFISNNLEYSHGYGGNHYIANIAGLMSIAASLPDAGESDSWLAYCLQEFECEIEKGIMPDGFYVEGSTFYQVFVTEMFIYAAALSGQLPLERRKRLTGSSKLFFKNGAGLKRWEGWMSNHERPEIFSENFYKKLRMSLDFLDTIRGPDGGIPQIGDNDSSELITNPGRTSSDLERGDLLLRALGGKEKSVLLPPGCLRERLGKETVSEKFGLFKDGGVAFFHWEPFFLVVRIGHEPGTFTGHIHSDMLSFQLWFEGHPLFVDPGSYVYTASPQWRNRFRSAGMHNAIVAPGFDPMKIPAASDSLFMANITARPKVTVVEKDRLEATLRGADNNQHMRRFYRFENGVGIGDFFDGEESRLLFHLHPSIKPGALEKKNNGLWETTLYAGEKKISWSGEGFSEVKYAPSFFSPRYGILQKSSCIIAKRDSEESVVRIFRLRK